jgi:ribosomal protein S18 acetylase RimI-like enzyme
MNFRTANLNDVQAIIELVHSAYRGDSSREGWTTEADLLDGGRTFHEEIEQAIESNDSMILLMEKNPSLMGSVHIKKISAESKRAYLGMFAVKPSLQNQGLGKALLKYAEDTVIENWNCTEIEMTVIQQRTELIVWYERRGYKLTGEVRAFPLEDERYGIPKVSNIALSVLLKQLN